MANLKPLVLDVGGVKRLASADLLDVPGKLDVNGHAAVGTTAEVNSVPAGGVFGPFAANTLLNLNEKFTDFTDYSAGVIAYFSVEPAVNNVYLYGFDFEIDVPSTNSKTGMGASGGLVSASYNGTGSLNTVIGLEIAASTGTSSNGGNVRGATIDVSSSGTGMPGDLKGLVTSVNYTANGSISNAHGLDFGVTIAGAFAVSDAVAGVKGFVHYSGTGTAANVRSFRGEMSIFGSTVATSAVGCSIDLRCKQTATITEAIGADILLVNENVGSTITSGRGIFVRTASNLGGGSFPTNIGIDIGDQSGVGSTLTRNFRSQGQNGQNEIQGILLLGRKSAPADAVLSASQFVFWLDDTPGATKLKVKAKDSAGTVRVGELALA